MKKLFILFMLLGCGNFLSAQITREESYYEEQSTHHKPPMQDSYGRHILPSEEMNRPSQGLRPPTAEGRDLPGQRLGVADDHGDVLHNKPNGGGAHAKKPNGDYKSGERGAFTRPIH